MSYSSYSLFDCSGKEENAPLYFISHNMDIVLEYIVAYTFSLQQYATIVNCYQSPQWVVGTCT